MMCNIKKKIPTLVNITELQDPVQQLYYIAPRKPEFVSSKPYITLLEYQ